MGTRVINIDPDFLGGTPVFFGTRVPLKNLFDYLETRETIKTFFADFESVTRKQDVRIPEILQKLIETSSNILPITS